jgi:phosphonate transport system ATP-binding protein
MQDAEVVFADEPVASLDPKAGYEVMELLWSVIKERNMSVICVLHQLEFAREFGERFIGLNSGELVFDAPASSLSNDDIEHLYQISPPTVATKHEQHINTHSLATA